MTNDPINRVLSTGLTMIFQIIGDIAIAIGRTTFKPELLD